MPIESPITEFCRKRGIPKAIKDAFSAYCRSEYAERFSLTPNSDTAYLLVTRLTEDQLDDAWQGFTVAMKKYLQG